MSATSMAAWRRQNSDPIPVEIQLVDGSMLKGTILVQRERTLKEVLGGPEPFFEFECTISGDIVLGKTAVAMVRPTRPQQTDHLEKRLKLLEKSEAHTILKVSKDASRERIREAYVALTRMYHPDRYAGAHLPDEVREYFNAVTRQLNAAYSELNVLLPADHGTAGAAA